jgi:cold-inducible RNA-binding protein
MRIYVGNLSYDTGDEDLRSAFEAHGEVSSAQVVADRDTGRSRGFGFVEMNSSEDANKAIAALNGTMLQGRTIVVNEARPRDDGGYRSGGNRGGRGGGGGGGRRY